MQNIRGSDLPGVMHALYATQYIEEFNHDAIILSNTKFSHN
jgi:hypothetical protein